MKKRGGGVPKSKPSPSEIMKLHKDGWEALLPGLTSTMRTLQPTSVPAERAFSRARFLRRYYQESLSDERFANFLFLRDFYSKNKPWEAFKTKYIITEQCNVKFVSN